MAEKVAKPTPRASLAWRLGSGAARARPVECASDVPSMRPVSGEATAASVETQSKLDMRVVVSQKCLYATYTCRFNTPTY